jgi:hypothetical protein
MAEPARRRRPVAARVFAQRQAVAEADLMRSGYFPLALAVRDVVAKQDTWNTQLNHSTSAANPADIRAWFLYALKIGRPLAFNGVRTAISRAFLEQGTAESRRIAAQLLREVDETERFAGTDGERLERLFEALERRDIAQAERLRDELVNRGSQESKRLVQLEKRVEQSVDRLVAQARARERVATWLLVSLTLATLAIGAGMAVYARRLLLPLGLVTDRAKAVASGDLKPRPAVVSND